MTNPIYKPKGAAGEYGDLALNIYTGCNHGCTYCFAPSILRKSTAQFSNVEPRSDIYGSVKRQLLREEMTGQLIHLCFTCDPYPANIDTKITRAIIRLIKYSGNNIQILTKGGNRASRDFDLLDANDSFGVTVTSYDSFSCEPDAAPTEERLDTLREAKALGIKTWVSCEPVVDPDFVCHLIKSADYIDTFKIGKLNHRRSEIDWKSFGATCIALCERYGRSYYIKADLLKYLKE